MIAMNIRSTALALVQAITITLMAATTLHADEYPFRAAFERVPGSEQVENGQTEEGIATLRAELQNGDPETRGMVLSTLCGAYVVIASFAAAEYTCNAAVEASHSAIAYNNRGVYHVLVGDWSGARRDFERARPPALEAYMEELWQRDVGLVATGNFDLIDDLQAQHAPEDIVDTSSRILADVEPINE
jgi:hypothetical protein